ncbi:MAG: ATP synthase subunit I [Phormidesmis sp.]
MATKEVSIEAAEVIANARAGEAQGPQHQGENALDEADLSAGDSRENPSGEDILLLPPSEASMQDYDQLQQNLLGLTVAFGVVIFPFIWGFYSWQIALDYILGACGGIVYLRMLGRDVSKIGRQKKNSSAGRLAVFAGMMIVALRWDQLEVIPVFLGFLTYKVAIIAFVLWTSTRPQRGAA